jgi:hypothetical protein
MTKSNLILRYVRQFATVALASAAMACGPFRKGAPAGEPAILVFSNQSLDQATVYAVVPGADYIRIGTVMAGRTEELRIPSDMVLRAGTINIVARLLARSNFPQTGPVSISPGERYEVTLPMDGRLLSFLPARQ